MQCKIARFVHAVGTLLIVLVMNGLDLFSTFSTDRMFGANMRQNGMLVICKHCVTMKTDGRRRSRSIFFYIGITIRLVDTRFLPCSSDHDKKSLSCAKRKEKKKKKEIN